MNLAKCVLGVNLLDFLGHRVDRHGILPLEKIDAVRHFPQPPSQSKLGQFLGLINFYHGFIPGCTFILQPLNALLAGSSKGDQRLVWTHHAEETFSKIKDVLTDATLLVHPQPEMPICLITDASDTTVGAVLQQRIDFVWSPLTYFSRKLIPAEIRYSTFHRDLLAVYLAFKHFRHFIEGGPFFIVTDPKRFTLALTRQSQHHSPHQIRHDFVSQFTSDILFLNGLSNAAPDALSQVEDEHSPCFNRFHLLYRLYHYGLCATGQFLNHRLFKFISNSMLFRLQRKM